jgi:hypothetical protein
MPAYARRERTGLLYGYLRAASGECPCSASHPQLRRRFGPGTMILLAAVFLRPKMMDSCTKRLEP